MAILHIGGDYVVPVKSIILILDYNKAIINKDTSNFLEKLQKSIECIKISEGTTKAIVLVEFLGKYKIYYSPISCATLLKRSIS